MLNSLAEAKLRHALYEEAAANRVSSYTVRMAYSRAADRELRRIKRLEQEERRRTQSTATVDTVGDVNALILSAVCSFRRR